MWQVLATGLGNVQEVWLVAGSSVWFSSRPGQEPHPLCLDGVLTWTGHKPKGFWQRWNHTAV